MMIRGQADDHHYCWSEEEGRSMVHFTVVGGWLVAGWWFEGQGVMMDNEVATCAGMGVENTSLGGL